MMEVINMQISSPTNRQISRRTVSPTGWSMPDLELQQAGKAPVRLSLGKTTHQMA